MNVDVARVQRRTVWILVAAQVLGGVAFGATLSLGALLAAHIAGDAFSGLATSFVTLGAAIAAIPLARYAASKGRRASLTLGLAMALVGIVVIVTAAKLSNFPLLLTGVALVGAGNAGSLQSRFAATDLAQPQHRARDLSTVVWASTVGGVLGPLLITPGEALGRSLGMPQYTGAYIISFAAQLTALVMLFITLRPDPLKLAQEIAARAGSDASFEDQPDQPRRARYAIFALAASHVVMASIMAMAPVHLKHLAHAGHAGHGSEALDPATVTTLVGITLAVHVAGMYGLSPLWGWLADRMGRVPVIIIGQVISIISLIMIYFWSASTTVIVIALGLVGLGWSASNVSSSALLTESSAMAVRTKRQGIGDSMMSLSAAVGAALAGLILAQFAYAGLAVAAFVLCLAIVALAPLARVATAPTSSFK